MCDMILASYSFYLSQDVLNEYVSSKNSADSEQMPMVVIPVPDNVEIDVELLKDDVFSEPAAFSTFVSCPPLLSRCNAFNF